MNYSETLINHFRHPRNAGMMRDHDGVGEATFDGCGDLARFYLKVIDGRVADVRFQTYGCGPTIAASSAGSELAAGRPVAELLTLSEAEITAALDGLPAERVHAARVVAGAIRTAARDYLARRERSSEAKAGRHV
ncbi:MAG: iron-sulfur cluster assembly scaffold protein [Candidatus Rokubacteria bacterium]|nr:iron-sulfur cluster assembly scaffold protein [Candidatus Rokubacteria bacterium]